MLQVRLLGQFEIRQDERPVELASRPAQSLFAYLVLNAGVKIRREKLAGLIWPESDETNARTYLRQALWRIRKAIGDDYLPSDRVSVAFDLETAYWLDVAVLESTLSDDSTTADLEAVVGVYKGDLLPGFYEEWVTRERERLQAVLERRMNRLLEQLIAAQAWPKVQTWSERWIAQGTTPEPAYRALMIAHAGMGDLAGMAASYERCVAALEAELGVGPSEETHRLFKNLQETGLASVIDPVETERDKQAKVKPEQQPVISFPYEIEVKVPEAPFIGREVELARLQSGFERAANGQGQVMFVSGEAGQGKTTLLHEFARRVQASDTGVLVANGACPVYTPVCAPYGLFREVLEILTGDVEAALAAGHIGREQAELIWRSLPATLDDLLQHGPNLIDTMIPGEALFNRAKAASVGQERLDHLKKLLERRSDSQDHLSDQGSFFNEFTGFLLATSLRRPLVLLLDDLHWTDPSSIGLLGHLGHQLPEGSIFLLGAFRPEEINQGRETVSAGGQLVRSAHPLAQVLAEYKRRFGDIVLALDEAASGNGRAFVDVLLDSQPNDLDQAFRQALTRHTGGHPLFTVELLEEMRAQALLQRNEQGRWQVDPDFSWDIVPPRVEGVIENRIGRLEPELRQWLDIASVEGESFTAEVIAGIQGLEARQVIKRLSGELDRQHRLVSPLGLRRTETGRLSRYQFSHNLFRQYLYTHLDDIERSYVHEQVGEILEGLFEGQTEDMADQLAHHYQMADLAHKAVFYLRQAGDVAARAYANEEAVSFYRQALEEVKKSGRDILEEPELLDLFTKLGRAFEHESDFPGALQVYREMEESGIEKGMLALRLSGMVAQGTLYAIPSPVHDPKKAQAISDLALPITQELGDRQNEARILWNLTIAFEYDNQLLAATEIGERALAIAKELNLPRQTGYIYSDLAGCYWVSGQLEKGIRLFQSAEAIWREMGNQPMLAEALHSGSLANMYAGNYDDALAQSEQSWQISKAIDNKWGLIQSWSRCLFIYRARGRFDEGIRRTNESLRLSRESGHDFELMVPSVELAFSFAYLGNSDRGLAAAEDALKASTKFPAFRPYILAAAAENHLAAGDLNKAALIVQQAKDDPYWQAFPVYCYALTLAKARLALAKGDNEEPLAIAEPLSAELRRLGVRSFLPDTLVLIGQVFQQLGRENEARSYFGEGRQIAEEMNARSSLWPILWHLSKIVGDPDEAQHLRHQARELVNFIADHAGSPELRGSFLRRPDVQELLGA